MSLKNIQTEEQFEELLGKGSFLLVKHSSTCPISKAAFEEYEKFTQENSQFNTAYLIVQDARDLSNYVSEKFHVKHESPQAILFKNGDVVWHASHWKITNQSLQEALSELNTSTEQ